MKLAFLDIETSGLNPSIHEVLEVAYVRVDLDDANSDSETHFSLPIDVMAADQKALQINKYYERADELFQIRTTPMRAAAKLLVELEGYMIVGANPTFDITFLRSLLDRYALGEPPTWHYRCIDLNTLAAGWVGNPLPISTQEIAEQWDVPLSKEQHTALADARWNRAVYDAIARSAT